MAKTLVTGGNGFVGSHVVRLLAGRGDDLRLTHRPRARTENIDDLELESVECDVLDRRAVRRALKGVDRVFHIAGLASLRPEDEERLYEVNVQGTRIVLEECLRAQVDRVVLTSSVGAIGPADPGQTADERQLFTAGRLYKIEAIVLKSNDEFPNSPQAIRFVNSVDFNTRPEGAPRPAGAAADPAE